MKIVIIGAGVAGLSIGWRLAQAGAEVTILERSQPASGATWAAAGMIAVTAEMLEASVAEIEFANFSNDLWPGFAKELEEITGRDLGYRHTGALILANDAVELGRLERQASGVLLDAAAVREKAPLLTGPLAGGLWAEHEAHIDNRALGEALAMAFTAAGGHLASNEAVVRLERHQNRAVVAHTPIGFHDADAFVLAAGAWSGLVEAELAPVTPVKGQMIALESPAGETPPFDRPPGPVIWGNGIYAVPRRQYLLIGATVEETGFDTSPTAVARAMLRSRAEALMPDLRRWTLVDHWAGLRPRSPDGLPLLGPTIVEGLWIAGGQYRNGILFAPAVARTMTDQILGQALVNPAFDPRRFTP